MKKCNCLLIALFIANSIYAQNASSTPLHVQSIMKVLEGQFQWKMTTVSSNEVIRQGTSMTNFEIDNMVLMGRESFNNSDVKQISFFGYRNTDSTFFSISHYNTDVGPHIMYGKLINDATIEFHENDTSRIYLNIEGHQKYNWTYQIMRNGLWIKRDLKIEFIKQN